MTTVETAMAVLYPSHFTTGSAPQHSRRAADGAARRSHQRRVAIDLQQAAQQNAPQNGDRHDDQVHDDGRHAHGRHLGQRQAEPVEDDAPAQHLLRAEPDARDPGFGQPVAQAVGVEHAQHDADDQGAEREPSDNGDFGDVKCRERKQRDQENSVQGVRPVTFFQHILAILMTTDNFCFIATAKVASFIGIRNKIWLSGIT